MKAAEYRALIKPSHNKYKVASKLERTYNGVVYDSKKEMRYAVSLDVRKQAGEIEDWQRQVSIPLYVNGHLIKNYVIDFVVYFSRDEREYVEVKGHWTREARLTWKLFKALYQEEFLAKGWRMTVVE